MSDRASGSAFSFMKTPAVVCGTETWQSPVWTPLSRTTCCTRSVMSIASARLPERTSSVSILAALPMNDIVTTGVPISHGADRHPIMAQRVTRPADRKRVPAGQLRSQLPVARHLLPAGRSGEPHQRGAVPLRHLGGGTVQLAG